MATTIPSPEELEAAGAVIGKVTVVVGDVFDTSLEGEGGWLYRTANRLHIQTRPTVIRNQLLFEEGDPYDHRLVLETERNLRESLKTAEVMAPCVLWIDEIEKGLAGRDGETGTTFTIFLPAATTDTG